MDMGQVFASHITKCTYEQIPREAIEAAKREILDTLGVAIAASGMFGNKAIADLLRGFGGTQESTVLVYGDRLPAPHTALINGTMARTLDWDDTHDESTGCHPGPAMVSGMFALAERVGKLDGQHFLTAYTIGVDLACRMMWAGAAGSDPPTPIVPGFSQQWACIAVAGAGSKLLHFDEEKTLNALGIAYCQAAGNFQSHLEGVEAKGMQVGFGAQAGVMATLLAELGLKGPRNSLEGQGGMYNLYYRGKYDRDILSRNLGERFESVGLTIKPYPSCRYTNAPIDATLAIVKDNNIASGEIEEITVSIDQKRVPFNVREPEEVKRRPSNAIEAQFSIPWAVATAAARKRVSLRDIGDVTDPVIQKLAQRVLIKRDHLLEESTSRGMPPVIVSIRTIKGSFSTRVDHPLGSIENPIDWDGLVNKFRDCITYAAKPLQESNIEQVIQQIHNLENQKDVGFLMHLLVTKNND